MLSRKRRKTLGPSRIIRAVTTCEFLAAEGERSADRVVPTDGDCTAKLPCSPPTSVILTMRSIINIGGQWQARIPGTEKLAVRAGDQVLVGIAASSFFH